MEIDGNLFNAFKRDHFKIQKDIVYKECAILASTMGEMTEYKPFPEGSDVDPRDLEDLAGPCYRVPPSTKYLLEAIKNVEETKHKTCAKSFAEKLVDIEKPHCTLSTGEQVPFGWDGIDSQGDTELVKMNGIIYDEDLSYPWATNYVLSDNAEAAVEQHQEMQQLHVESSLQKFRSFDRNTRTGLTTDDKFEEYIASTNLLKRIGNCRECTCIQDTMGNPQLKCRPCGNDKKFYF